MIRALLFSLLIAAAGPAAADEIRCAVAANFAGCLAGIASAFEDSTGHTVVISSGSTGAHYAQINQGAPFDIFFAADVERPERLEAEGFTVPGSRATYALGRLVLWVRFLQPGEEQDLGTTLDHPDLKHLAIADPDLAPYGRAARQVLDALGYDEERLVFGRNVAQVWQFVASGNAQAGFVAASQVPPGGPAAGAVVPVPAGLHDPIRQQVVILKGAPDAAAELRDYVLTGPGRDSILAGGYAVESTP